MNKAYFIAPLAALVVFSTVYAVHRDGLKEREAAKVAADAAALQAKNEADLAARKLAMAQAIAAAEQRKKEKEAREAREQADREVRQAAIDARDRAYRDQERVAKQIERLKKDIEAERSALAKLETSKKEAVSEQAFLADFVVKSRANVQALQSLIDRLNQPAPAATVASR